MVALLRNVRSWLKVHVPDKIPPPTLVFPLPLLDGFL